MEGRAKEEGEAWGEGAGFFWSGGASAEEEGPGKASSSSVVRLRYIVVSLDHWSSMAAAAVGSYPRNESSSGESESRKASSSKMQSRSIDGSTARPHP